MKKIEKEKVVYVQNENVEKQKYFVYMHIKPRRSAHPTQQKYNKDITIWYR